MLKRISGFFSRFRRLAKPVGKVRKIGSMRFFRTPAGAHVIVFPVCKFPLPHLIPENWDAEQKSEDIGNVRAVFQIDKLVNGTKTGFYVKSPERMFTRDLGWIKSGDVWHQIWEAEQGKVIQFKPGAEKAVERMASKEAKILLQLTKSGIKTEYPFALVVHANGERQLLTTPVVRWTPASKERPRFADEKFEEKIGKAGLESVDFDLHNLIAGEEGINIIDVHRWKGAGTEKYMRTLIEALQKQLEKQKKKASGED